MNELQVVVNHPNYFLEHIEWNREDFQAEVNTLLRNYENVVYTDDQMDIMKKDRATLNATKKAINDRRIEIKKAVMRPYDKFEEEVKEITTQIDEVVGKIDERVKTIEAEKKAEKREKLEECFIGVAGDLGPDITFERIFDSKWLNASVSLSKAQKEITERIDVIRNHLAVIEKYDEDDRVVAKSTYLRTLDWEQTLNDVTRQRFFREEEKKRKEAKQKMAEEEAAKKEEVKEEAADHIPEEKPKEPAEEKKFKTSINVSLTGVGVKKVFDYINEKGIAAQTMISIDAYGTKNQLLDFKEFLDANNIKYGKQEGRA